MLFNFAPIGKGHDDFKLSIPWGSRVPLYSKRLSPLIFHELRYLLMSRRRFIQLAQVLRSRTIILLATQASRSWSYFSASSFLRNEFILYSLHSIWLKWDSVIFFKYQCLKNFPQILISMSHLLSQIVYPVNIMYTYNVHIHVLIKWTIYL